MPHVDPILTVLRAKVIKSFIFLSLILFSVLPAETFLQQVRAKIIDSQPFKTDFVQQVFIDGEKTIEESGYIVFADRSLVKWQYLQPDYKTFIMKNRHYSFYDQENNQLFNGRINPKNEQIIWDLLFSEKPGQVSRWEARTQTILLSVDEGSGPQELKIKIGNDFLPERIEQTSVDEITTIYMFKNYQANINLESEEFALKLPVSVKVIEE